MYIQHEENENEFSLPQTPTSALSEVTLLRPPTVKMHLKPVLPI